MKKVLMFFGLILIILLNTCAENPINSDENVPPGRRDYVWTVDTIPVLNASMRDIWGSSPTDIWICGDADNRRESVWHYDGINFTPSGEYILAPTSLWGSAPNDIWLGTVYSQLWHYDGVDWTKHTDLEFPGYTDVVIESICGTAANNIYATGMADSFDGYRGVIIHFDGNNWEYVDIPDIRVNFHEIKYDASSNSYLIAAANFDHIGTPERLYLFKDGNLTELYGGELLTGIGSLGAYIYVYQVNLTAKQNKIYRYQNRSLSLTIDLSNTQYAGRIWGRNEKDFFCVNWPTSDDLGGLGHYNGTNLITIYHTKFWAPDAIIFRNEMFFLGDDQDFNTQVIIKGTISNK